MSRGSDDRKGPTPLHDASIREQSAHRRAKMFADAASLASLSEAARPESEPVLARLDEIEAKVANAKDVGKGGTVLADMDWLCALVRQLLQEKEAARRIPSEEAVKLAWDTYDRWRGEGNSALPSMTAAVLAYESVQFPEPGETPKEGKNG